MPRGLERGHLRASEMRLTPALGRPPLQHKTLQGGTVELSRTGVAGSHNPDPQTLEPFHARLLERLFQDWAELCQLKKTNVHEHVPLEARKGRIFKT